MSRRLARLSVLSVLAVALAGALVVAPSQTEPADAHVRLEWKAVQTAVKNSGFQRIDISIHAACSQQKGAGAYGWPWSWSNPYSWSCYRVISWAPYRLAYLGGVDLNRYCRENHPGTPAYLDEPRAGALGWTCIKWA